MAFACHIHTREAELPPVFASQLQSLDWRVSVGAAVPEATRVNLSSLQPRQTVVAVTGISV